MPTDLLGRIHSSTDTTSPDWATFRGEVTGAYLLSGQGGEWDSQHLIREYNRNINSLYKSWTPTEPNATGLFLEPYNAGFSYQGTGDFRDYKWDTYSVDFDGVDEKILLPTNLSAWTEREQKTLSVWVKNGGNTTEARIFNTPMKATASTAFALGVGYDTDNSAFYFLKTAGGVVLKADFGDVMDTTSWYHFAIVQDGTVDEAYIYQNGVLKATVSNVGEITVTDTTVAAIGAHWWSSYENDFNGMVDECAIFNSALSAVQIRAIYNGGTPQSLTPYSPLSWWRMGDGTLDDGSANLIGDQMDPTLGSDLITNGTFTTNSDWTKGAGWTISDGVASHVAGSSSDLYQDAGLGANGTPYQVTFTVSNYSAGTVKCYVGENGVGIERSANGTYTEAIGVVSGPNFYMQASSSFVGSIDNVVVKKVNGNAGIMKNMEAADIVAEAPISDKWDVYSVLFDGVDEYVNTEYIVPAISTLTISAWFRHDGVKGGNQFIISDWSAAGSWAQSGRGMLGFYAQTVLILMSDGTNYYYARSADTYDASAFFDDAWHHAAITINTETQKFYLDGALVHTHDTTDAATRTGGTSAVLGTAGTDFETIGRAGSYAGDYWDGSIDEVAVFNSALSAAQVVAIYNEGVPADLSSLSPVSWWRMGDGDYYRILHDAAATDANALYLAGIANNYASIPDAADLDGFTDFTLEATVALDDWTSENYLMAKTVSSSVGWFILMRATGVIRFYFSSNGSSWLGPYDSTAATGITDGTSAQIRLVRDGTTLRFYVDGLQLGDNVTISDATIHNSTAVVELGVREASLLPLTGKISRARIWSDATQTTNVLDVNFALQTKGAPSFTATSGQTVTIHTTAIANPAVIRGATDGVIVNDAALRADTP